MQLDLDHKLDLQPADFIGQRIAILGSSGNGKTNSIALILEYILRLIPFTIFDPHNEYWGLCESYDILRVGKGEGVQIEAGPEQAAQIAEMAYTKRLSVLVEMLEMTEDERLEFIANYCGKLWQLKVARQPYGVVLEEAQNVIPETKALSPALKQMKQFALEGRKFGISVIISTQRPAEVNKTVLGQCRVAFLHGVDIRNDVDAYAGMLPYSAAEVKKIALNLGTGECIVKIKRDGPAQYHHPVRMCLRQTFHVGDTPTFDQGEMPVLRGIDAALLAEVQAALKAPETVSGMPVLTEPYVTSDHPWMKAKWIQHQYSVMLMAVLAEQGRLKKQLALADARERVRVVEPVQQPLPMLHAEEVFERSVTTTTVETYRSSRAVSMAANKQRKGFNTFLQRIGDQRPMHRRILALALDEPNKGLSIQELAMRLDYSYERVRGAAVDLFKMGLLLRLDTSTYQSNVAALFQERYADLQVDELIEQVWKVIEE